MVTGSSWSAASTRQEIVDGMKRAREAQCLWKTTSISHRAKIAKRVAELLSERGEDFARSVTIPQRRNLRDTFSSEILPLADAAHWLSRQASKHLAPSYFGKRGLPWWLGKLESIVVREPLGIVLILATWNYPLYLMGVQSLQALIAGNAICIKRGIHTEEITRIWIELLVDSGVPADLLLVLEESVSSFDRAIEVGVDMVVMTGSSQTGRKVLEKLAPTLTPAILELSGCDPMFVLPTADLQRVARAIRFSTGLNSGATCMAVRRVLIDRSIYAQGVSLIREAMAQVPKAFISDRYWEQIAPVLERAMEQGAKSELTIREALATSCVEDNSKAAVEPGRLMRPWVLWDVTSSMDIASMDLFFPLVMLIPVDSVQDALEENKRCPYALTASIFGDPQEAERLALQIDAGSVTINDIIVPTVDPRLPFGGRRESGFGVTRGLEGLLALTRPKSISTRRGRWLPHLEDPTPSDEAILFGILKLLHAKSWSQRWEGLRKIVRRRAQ